MEAGALRVDLVNPMNMKPECDHLLGTGVSDYDGGFHEARCSTVVDNHTPTCTYDFCPECGEEVSDDSARKNEEICVFAQASTERTIAEFKEFQKREIARKERDAALEVKRRAALSDRERRFEDSFKSAFNSAIQS